MTVEGVFATSSEEETSTLAARFAAQLPPASVVLLTGDLGAGKTAFVRGMAAGLGIDPDAVSSPTFTLIQEYRRREEPPLPSGDAGPTLYHVDLFRLEGPDIDDLGLEELTGGDGITAIEWAEKLPRSVPGAISVTITDGGGDRREILITKDSGAGSQESGRLLDPDSS